MHIICKYILCLHKTVTGVSAQKIPIMFSSFSKPLDVRVIRLLNITKECPFERVHHSYGLYYCLRALNFPKDLRVITSIKPASEAEDRSCFTVRLAVKQLLLKKDHFSGLGASL